MTFEELNKLNNTSLEELFKTDPPSSNVKLDTLKGYFPYMEKSLKRKGITREYLWNQYISDHPDGYRLSMFKEHYNRWRKQSVGMMHIEHKAGDKMQVDYAGNRLEIVDLDTGELRPVEVFVAILGASQLTYVEASISQKKEDFIQSCENALHYFGGVPQAIITDNLKSAVIKSDKYEPTLNEAFRGLHPSLWFIGHCLAEPTSHANKALVDGIGDNPLPGIYSRDPQENYTSLADLNQDIFKNWTGLQSSY